MSDNFNLSIIDQIISKYNIGKRPLSIILGLGETTIARYYSDGSKPSGDVLDILNSILNNPNEYLGYLEKNKDKITKIAYGKSKQCVEKILSKTKNTDDKLKEITSYILSRNMGITNLKLQKLLYYCQLFSYVLNDKPLFNSQIEAWQHGPVYSNVYLEYKAYGDKEIESYENKKNNISEEDKKLVDNILNSFGILSGNVLSYFTHCEKPWKSSYNKANNSIDSEKIRNYAVYIKEKYKTSNSDVINKYVNDMIENYTKGRD